MSDHYLPVLRRLRGLKPAAGWRGWRACCPVHKGGRERRPSLSAWVGRNGGLLLRCHSCRASIGEICQALGVTLGDLFPPDSRPARPWKPRVKPVIVATYDYVAADGELLYQKVRYQPKSFGFRHPGPAGGPEWLSGLGGRPHVPYRLPELLAWFAEQDRRQAAWKDYRPGWCWITEGEKDCDALWALGLAATTSDGGAGCWPEDFGELFVGRKVAIVPDNDEPGRKHAQLVAGNLAWHGAGAVRVVKSLHAGAFVGHDVSDWLASWPRGVKPDFIREALLKHLVYTRPTWGTPKRKEGTTDGEADGEPRNWGEAPDEDAGEVRGDAADRPHAEGAARV